MKKQIIILVLVLILIILLCNFKEKFLIKPGDIYAIKSHDTCPSFSTEVTVNNGQTNLCVKERGDAESGIRNLSVVEDDIISNTNDINSFFIPNKSKYIGS